MGYTCVFSDNTGGAVNSSTAVTTVGLDVSLIRQPLLQHMFPNIYSLLVKSART